MIETIAGLLKACAEGTGVEVSELQDMKEDLEGFKEHASNRNIENLYVWKKLQKAIIGYQSDEYDE